MAQRIRKKTFLVGVLFYYFICFCLSDIDHNLEDTFTKVEWHELQGKVIETKTVDDSFECTWSCLLFLECLSINFAALPNKDGLYECVLLRNETSGSFGLLQPSQTYHHYSRFEDNCATPRCLNSGTCKSLFGGFQCLCPNEFMGKLCEKVSGKNCAEVLKNGGMSSGVYDVNPDGQGLFKVYCDQSTTGGGWTVFQKRQDGSVDFYRVWNGYKNGFGILTGEFWLGLDKIYRLTNQTRNRLRVELADWEGNRAYVEYDYFAVANENNKYTLSLGNYTGNASDGLTYHHGIPFSTRDRDNDEWVGSSCAASDKGGWWFKSCHHSHLNGEYISGGETLSTKNRGINWEKWKGDYYSLKRAEMKMRPL